MLQRCIEHEKCTSAGQRAKRATSGIKGGQRNLQINLAVIQIRALCKINPSDFLSCVVLDRSFRERLVLSRWPASKNNQLGKLPPKIMSA